MRVVGTNGNVRHSAFWFAPDRDNGHEGEPVFIVEFPDQADGGATAMVTLDWMVDHVAYNRELWTTMWDWEAVSVRLPRKSLEKATLTVTEKDGVMTLKFWRAGAASDALIFEHSV